MGKGRGWLRFAPVRGVVALCGPVCRGGFFYRGSRDSFWLAGLDRGARGRIAALGRSGVKMGKVGCGFCENRAFSCIFVHRGGRASMGFWVRFAPACGENGGWDAS